MGLTIHYDLRSRTRSNERAHRLVEQMRQLALDLPFEEVSDIIVLEGDQCDVEVQRGKVAEDLFWLLIQGGQFVKCPWNPDISRSVSPTRLLAFHVFPGPGSEPINIGLCQYPREIDWQYEPATDRKFQQKCQFSWRKWMRWLGNNGHEQYLPPEKFTETRNVKTKLGGWHWSSFCKTQYASDPRCGGVANFLRCHISTITLLDRIAKLPTMQVQINDEGEYGASYYTDDPSVSEPHYRWHDGKYDPKALAQEVGEWNGMIAALTGAMDDMLEASDSKVKGSSPIHGFPNFEHLEFKGSQDEHLQPFLQAMAKVAEREQTKHGT